MTDEALFARKKRSRAGHRASTTRILDQATTAMGADPLDTGRLSLLKRMLDEKMETLRDLDSELADLVPEEELEAEIQHTDEYKEKVYDVLAKLDNALLTTATVTPHRDTTGGTPATAPPPADGTADGTPTDRTRPSAPGATCSDPSARVKLPKITLPRFNGNLMRWTAFWDSYHSAIHTSRQLSDVDKFNYLRSLLDNTAYEAIAGLALSAANYQEAIEVLKKRFGNRQLIISRHMESLLSVTAISSDHQLMDLRRLYDQSETNIRSLKALGVEPASYGTMLSSVLLTKLPPELRLIVSRKISSDDLDMDSLLKTFEQELTARERANNTSSQPSPRRNTGQGRPPTSALIAGIQGPPSCCYCEQSHSSADCTSVSDVDARKKILMNSGRCFNCLRKNHRSRDCRSSSKCKRCQRKHHTSICYQASSCNQTPSLTTKPKTDLNPGAPSYVLRQTTSTLCSTEKRAVLLQTACTVVHNPMKPEVVLELRILFDSGSQRSYITDRAKKLLQLVPKGEQTLSIATFGALKEQTRVCPIVDVGVVLKGYPTMSLSLYTVPSICEPLSCQPITACVEANNHLLGLELADSSDGNTQSPVDMLIGCDHYWDLVTGSICRSERGPTAIHTKLGWVLSGPTPSSNPALRSATNCSVIATHLLRVDCQALESTQLEEQLRSFWELESLGIHEEERTLYDDFASSITFKNGRYKVLLPWKDFHEPLPDNYLLSLKRLQGLLCRLRQDHAMLKEYDNTIKDQIAKGIVELVPSEKTNANRVHYLPHHPVVRRDKSTTKLRVVYDASARSNGPSLNECLYKGPKFQQLILDLLVRFRSYNVALTADVEKAFLMIAVDERDRDALRFIWVDDVTKAEPELRVYRFARVVFGVSASPFLLNATVKYHLEQFLESNEVIVKRLLQSTYVDDVISGAKSEDEAFDLYTQSKEIFRQGGFNLRKFLTNSETLQTRIDFAEANLSKIDHNTPAAPGAQTMKRTEECKVLGVTWNPSNDCLVFDLSDLSVVADDLQPTKRNVVSLIGRIYDPLGFLAPITIKFKILFQKLCQAKLEWDCDLPEELHHEWRSLIVDLKEAGPISIPRSYTHRVGEAPASYTLCGFCDASTRAYAAVAYLVIESGANREVKFVVSKTRVAPLQTQTIPRLELLSAFLLSKLIVSVKDSLAAALPELSMRCYTDSLVALYWIRGTTKEWKPFVNNRVSEIRRRVHPSCWNHCPGVSNPADLPSRGLPSLELSVSQLWRRGPDWMQTGFEPSSESDVQCIPRECAAELKATQYHNLLSMESEQPIETILDPARFSTLSRLIGVTVQVLRAVQKFKQLKRSKATAPTIDPIEERQAAETLWVKGAQNLLYQRDFKTLTRQFNLFQDEKGVWRCGGRLSNAEIPFAAKYPILLPRGHPLTVLVVKEAHERVCHDGIKETLTETRSRFWIPKGRSLTRKIIHSCVLCRRFEGRPYKPPQPPPLPICRVKEGPAFTYTGVDFAGPLMIRAYSSHQSNKVWIALFTCYVTRAVHLEVVPDQSTPAFIRCMKRFAARRGLPKRFISDNGKTFKAAAKYLDAVFKDGSVQEHLTGIGITWQFNVERAPWWGGAFERMVRSTKRCLRKLIGRAQFSHDELSTALAEIEAVINSRPLSYLSSDDVEEPLTPSHLIVGRRILNLPDHLSYMCDLEDSEFTLDSNQATNRVKHLNNILNHFWNRWRREYLSELREVHSNIARKQPTSDGHSRIAIGDIVIVRDDQLPRGLWKLGRVQEVMEGRDGLIRGAVVRVACRDKQHLYLRRPIQLLYPLEVHSQQSYSTPEPQGLPDEITPEVGDVNEQVRPRRAASRKADETMKGWIADLEEDDRDY